MKKISSTYLKHLKPKEKVYRVPVDERLFLEVRKTGKKFWSLRYTINGAQKTKSLGEFPYVGINDAKAKAIEYYKLATQGIIITSNKFDYIFQKWLEDKKIRVKEKTALRDARIYANYLKKDLAHMDILKISPQFLIQVLKKIEKLNKPATLDKAIYLLNGVFEFACLYELVNFNPISIVGKKMKRNKGNNYSHIDNPADLQKFLLHLDDYNSRITKMAVLFQIHTFVRTGNIVTLEWKDIDFNTAVWSIKREKMKSKKEHIVPLSKQSIDILMETKKYTGNYKFVFSNLIRKSPLSDATIRKAVKKISESHLGYHVVPHGFRHTASTFLNEMGFNFLHIEKQLSHEDDNKVRSVYNKAQYLKQREKMMQYWSDYLDELKISDVPQIKYISFVA